MTHAQPQKKSLWNMNAFFHHRQVPLFYAFAIYSSVTLSLSYHNFNFLANNCSFRHNEKLPASRKRPLNETDWNSFHFSVILESYLIIFSRGMYDN